MVALDNHALFGDRRHARFRITLAPLVGAIAIVAVALVLGAILARGFSENGFRLGSQLAWRYALLRLLRRPGGRAGLSHRGALFPFSPPPKHSVRKLVWGFCASYGVYLLSVFLPNVIQPSAGATLMVLFGAGVVLVMAVAAAPLKRLGGKPIVSDKVRRVLLGGAAIYFWLCYCLMALARISGPHRPDAFYGISLCMMVTATSGALCRSLAGASRRRIAAPPSPPDISWRFS